MADRKPSAEAMRVVRELDSITSYEDAALALDAFAEAERERVENDYRARLINETARADQALHRVVKLDTELCALRRAYRDAAGRAVLTQDQGERE